MWREETEANGEKKRKEKEENGAVSASDKKAREDHCNAERTLPEDGEVDEFFAIIRRMRAAVSYFGMNNRVDGRDRGSKGKQTLAGSEKYRDSNGVRDETVAVTQEVTEDNKRLDLNADPVPEPEPEPEPDPV